ncbi:MAG TPA: hypothetical protein VFE58_05195 [Tepidisphaeraceae bacterium]|jgi:hypothetical protein|nr:hypothetical protein [Tepidisphaeraceae bacterium]
MPDQNPLTPAQQEFERLLRGTAPSAGRLDTAAAAFNAGQRSSLRQLRVWRSATALLLITTITPHLLPIRQTTSPTPMAPTFTTLTAPEPLQPQSLLALQQSVRDHGLDGLPASHPPALQPLRAKDFF